MMWKNWFSVLVASLIIVSSIPMLGNAHTNYRDISPRDANYLLSITEKNKTQNVDLQSYKKYADFGFQVKNIGDSARPYCDLMVHPLPTGWDYTFIPGMPVEINPGKTKTIICMIYPDLKAKAKRYTFYIKGKPGCPTANYLTVNVNILPYADFEVLAPPPKHGNPGDTIEYKFEILNKGNKRDRYFIKSIDNGIPTWNIEIKDDDNWTKYADPGSRVSKDILVTIPWEQKTTEGTQGVQLTLTVMSELNNSKVEANWTFTGVDHIYDIGISVAPKNVEISPGEYVEFDVDVNNYGNGWDNISLNASADFESEGWSIALENEWFNLSPRGYNKTKLKVTPPTTALKGYYVIKVFAKSSGPPYPQLPIEREDEVTIVVSQVKTIKVTPEGNQTLSEPIMPGNMTRFSFNITNEGNGEDIVNITIVSVPPGWYATLDFYQNIRLQAGARQEISMTVRVSANPLLAKEGNYNIVLRIWNSDNSSVINKTFIVPIKKVVDFTLKIDDDEAEVNPYGSGKSDFLFKVINKGNGPDEIKLELGGPNANWGSLTMDSVSLQVNETKTVILTVLVPKGAEKNRDYQIILRATSKTNKELVREQTVTIKIVEMDVSVTRNVKVNWQEWIEGYTVKKGETLNISVDIYNRGTKVVRGLKVAFYDNDELIETRNITSLGKKKSMPITIRWRAEIVGDHTITVKVDPDNSIGESDEENNIGTVNITVKKVLAGTGDVGEETNYMFYGGVLLLLIILIIGAALYAQSKRKTKIDKEMYESIYGSKEEQERDYQQRISQIQREMEAPPPQVPPSPYEYREMDYGETQSPTQAPQAQQPERRKPRIVGEKK